MCTARPDSYDAVYAAFRKIEGATWTDVFGLTRPGRRKNEEDSRIRWVEHLRRKLARDVKIDPERLEVFGVFSVYKPPMGITIQGGTLAEKVAVDRWLRREKMEVTKVVQGEGPPRWHAGLRDLAEYQRLSLPPAPVPIEHSRAPWPETKHTYSATCGACGVVGTCESNLFMAPRTRLKLLPFRDWTFGEVALCPNCSGVE